MESNADKKSFTEQINKGITFVLERKGITEKEKKVYLYLSREGAQSAGKIAKSLKIGRVQTYRILQRLENKSVIESIIESPNLFLAVPFNELLESVITKEKKTVQFLEKNREKILEYLMPKNGFQNSIYPNKFSLIKGRKQFNSKIVQIFRNANKELLMNINNFHIIRNFQYGQLDKIENTLHGRSRILIFFPDDDESKKTIPLIDDILDSFKKIKFHYLVLKSNSQNIDQVQFFILSEKECLYYLNSGKVGTRREESALWTNNRSFIETQKKIFEDFWQKSEILTPHCLWPD